MGSVSGILLLRNGRAVLGRLLLALLVVPPIFLLADTVTSHQWFATVFAVFALGMTGFCWVAIPKVVFPAKSI
ncbi:hypothetical protein D7D52_34960 [Nocardia yunnanensis]|uniref:Uncharacterized protein n=2 Tax=Nocardia yunnanensis TaxID=2382165 RepID=A0A386ZLK5_9NOCA|nr:hypothetical protein D7D52_34960 [Nocardia yunnanensis]